MNITDARIRQIENEQAALPGATRNNLTIRTVRAVLAEMGVSVSTVADGSIDEQCAKLNEAVAASESL
ncbi:hypothetical protein G3N95_15135 [Paraburkholderia sp. Tr-20389]|uniref:hypothetical protein n=1 Tax=Paraburkholderia sp. Tr-20389 TaxID=2703903 RepID=UPI0019811AF2|nr:hypothetical protein [Paraburkholderia sp. Tr-20389]MBN3754285.1 hypothetical protein [Paraburkholderia sp. Tr-20389]